MGRQIIELTGEKIGSWTVLGEAGRKNGGVLWECQCSCGTVEEVRSIDLTKKTRLSCQACSRIDNLLPKGQSGLNTLYDRYVQTTKRRSLEWNLSKDEVKQLTSSNCYYCDREPSQVCYGKGKTKQTRDHGSYVYNGICRVDSSVGFVIGNVRSCCRCCISVKGSMSDSDFFKLVYSIVEKHPKK